MRRAVGLLLLAGCNQLFDLKPTTLGGDAIVLAQLCDPLPFDANRYRPLDYSANGGVNWGAARIACQRLGYDLAVIDANDSAEITNELQGAPIPFWLGVSYDGSQWSALDTCTPALGWANGQPQPVMLGDCAMQNSGGLYSYDCTNSMAGPGISVLCETPRPSPECRFAATQRDYVVVTDSLANPTTHDLGETTCAGMGRHLVEIDSTDELDYLRANHPEATKFWIGATTNFVAYSSPTGCPQVFEWALGEPDNVNPCTYYDSTGMHAAPCNMPAITQASVICELNAAP